VLAGLKENFERTMQHRPVLDAKGKETGIYAYNGRVANRALEPMGKELGMFIDRTDNLNWDGDSPS
jgi:phage terminase small subunit